MKLRKNHKCLVLLLAAVILSFNSCDDAEYSVKDSVVYLVEASGVTNGKKVTVDDKGGVASLSIRTNKKAEQDVKTTVSVNPSAIDEFNKKNGANYVVLPVEFFSLSGNEAIITKGNVSASPISINFKALTQELINSGDKFALALTVSSNDTEVLDGAESVVYILDQVIVTSVPVLKGSRPVKLDMRQDYDVTNWSLEMRVNMSQLGTAIGQLNNQAIFVAGPGEGKGAEDGEIYIRFGDAPIKGNVLQVKTQGTQINCNTEFSANRWYHLAFVCDGTSLKIYVDGTLDATLTTPNKPLHLDKVSFMLCGSGSWLKADVMMSEVRFYTKAISLNQIQNNMFAISPATDGLEGYWKMNEGEGTIFNDATGNGNEGRVQGGDINWIHGIRSDGK